MTNPAMKQGDDHRIIRTEHNPVRSILFSPWYLPTVVTLAFAIRLCWILIFHPDPVDDFNFYFWSAESIARGYGYAPYGGLATAYFPIGYPLFLAMLFWVFGVSVTVAQTANLILSVASLVLVYWIARDLFRSELAGRLSLLFLAIYPNNIAYTSLVGVEIFYLFLLFLGVSLLLPCISIKGVSLPGRLLTAGLVFGFATLVKVQTLLLPAFLLLLFPQFSWEGRSLVNRLKRIAILYVALIGVLIPWVIRNYRLYNDIVLSNNDGLNLYIGNGPEANGGWVAIPWFDVRNDILDEHKINKIARRKAIDYIKTHPLQTLTLIPKKLIVLFDQGDGVYWNTIDTGSELILTRYVLQLLDQLNMIYEFVVYIFFVASLIFGCWKRLRFGKGHGWPLLGIVVILYFICIYLMYYGDPRYNIPIIPWMIIYSAALLSSLFAKVAHGNSLMQKS
jgi:4-amino-4-deoxy-L-arabinose transferase-like glycosyltransferase